MRNASRLMQLRNLITWCDALAAECLDYVGGSLALRVQDFGDVLGAYLADYANHVRDAPTQFMLDYLAAHCEEYRVQFERAWEAAYDAANGEPDRTPNGWRWVLEESRPSRRAP